MRTSVPPAKRRGGGEVAQLVEVGRYAQPFGSPLVVVGKGVRLVGLATVGRRRQYERVRHGVDAYMAGVSPLVSPALLQKGKHGVVQCDTPARVGLCLPFGRYAADHGQAPGYRQDPAGPVHSDHRRAHHSPRRAPVTAAKAIAAATMGWLASVALMSRWTSATSGAETVEWLSPGGVDRSAGFKGTMPHLTARPSAACNKTWWRRTDQRTGPDR